MANHVANQIRVENFNEEVIKFLNTFFQFEDLSKADDEIIKKLYEDAPEELDYHWMIDNCGAKWITYEGTYNAGDYYEISLQSAWYPPNDWVEKLSEKLRTIEPDVVVYNEYIDEGYNHAGIYYTTKDYVNHHEEDMDEWDIDKFHNDESGDYIDEFYISLRETIDHIKEDHQSERNANHKKHT